MFFNSLLTNFAALEVGQHLYWQIGNIRLHGQVFLTSWILLGALLVFAPSEEDELIRLRGGCFCVSSYSK